MTSKARKVPKGFNPKSYERPGLTEDEILEIKEVDLFIRWGEKLLTQKNLRQL